MQHRIPLQMVQIPSTITAGKANIGNIAVDGVNNKITMGNGASPVTLDGANGHLDGLTNTTWVPGVTKANYWPCCYRRSITTSI